MRYTPWIVSQHVPDFSTLDNLVRSERFAGKVGQDLVIALWQVMVDRDLGIFHYCPAQEVFWGKDCNDPLKVLNVYGFTICHVHANVLAMLCKAAGFPVRIANIAGHEGSEVFYDGKWHYLDADIQMFHRLRPPQQDVIASREDLYRDPSLVDDQPNPSDPYCLPDRLPANMRKLYEAKPQYLDIFEERIHSMDYRLRPGEEMTRYFHHRGRWVVFANYPGMFTQYRDETGPEGPTERFWPRRQWGNGYFRYAPRISSDSRDVELGADEIENLRLQPDGLFVEEGGGRAVFALESPYIYCGISDPMRRVPPVNGATLSAVFALPAGASARIEAAPERSNDWQPLWSSTGQSGEVDCKVDFTPLAESRYRLRLRFILEGNGASLKRFETLLWFMVSPHSLPSLRTAGENRMRLHSGDADGLNTRTLMLEHHFNKAESIATAHSTHNLRHEPDSIARLLPADPAKPWQVTYEVAAPDAGRMVRASIYAVIEGRKPDEAYDGHTARIEMADSPDGPWQCVADKPILEHAQGWHFGLFGEGRFGGNARKAYIRLSARKGALGIRVAAHYVPSAAAVSSMLEIEHAWYEEDPQVGRRRHTHLERTGTTEHEYVVRCNGTPHDERITLRVPSVLK
jgi:hypothetical protein